MSFFTPDLPTWTQVFVAMGGSSLLSGGLTWLTSYRMATASTRKTNAEAVKLENDNRGEAARIEAARNDFERALNERTSLVMDSLESQVRRLSTIVEKQTVQLMRQSEQISNMEWEIKSLRKALDERTAALAAIQNSNLSLKLTNNDKG